MAGGWGVVEERANTFCNEEDAMPDEKGRLIQDDFQKLEAWMRTHPPRGMRCLACGNQPLNLHKQLVVMVPTDGTTPHQTAGPVLHSILLTCDTCGSIHTLDARTVGILP